MAKKHRRKHLLHSYVSSGNLFTAKSAKRRRKQWRCNGLAIESSSSSLKHGKHQYRGGAKKNENGGMSAETSAVSQRYVKHHGAENNAISSRRRSSDVIRRQKIENNGVKGAASSHGMVA